MNSSTKGIRNRNGFIEISGDNSIYVGICDFVRFAITGGIVIHEDGETIPVSSNVSRLDITEKEDSCGTSDMLSIEGKVHNNLNVRLEFGIYRNEPSISIDMEVENCGEEDVFLDRLILVRGIPPYGGFTGTFPDPVKSRFLEQPHCWNGHFEVKNYLQSFIGDTKKSSYWNTVIGTPDIDSLAIGITEPAKGNAEISFISENNRVGMEISTILHSDMKGRLLRLPQSKSWKNHRMLLYAGDSPENALDGYVDFVCRYTGINMQFKPYTGLFTAYGSDPENKDPGKVPLSEERITILMNIVRKYLRPYGLTIIKTQFHGFSSSKPDGTPVRKLTDDESGDFEKVKRLVDEIRKKGFAPEDYDSRKNYHHGLGWHVKRLSEEGYVPALVCRPFYNIKAGSDSLDKAAADLFEMTVNDWEYRYLMLDFIGEDYDSDNDMVTVEEGIFNRFKAIRNRVGKNIFIEACMVPPGPVLGVADGYRVAHDWRGGLEEDLAPSFACRYHYHGRFFQCDSEFIDPAKHPFTWGKGGVEEMISTEERLKLWASYNAVLGFNFLAGGCLERVEPDRWKIFQRALPVQSGRAKALDFFENSPPRHWIRECITPSGKHYLIALFNWNKSKCDDSPIIPSSYGLDNNTDYIWFDFWSKQVYGPVKILPNWLAPFSCRIIHVSTVPNIPKVVGNTRHITGMTGIDDWHFSNSDRVISASFSGAPISGESFWIWLPCNEGVDDISGAEYEFVRPNLIRLHVIFNESGQRNCMIRLDDKIPVP